MKKSRNIDNTAKIFSLDFIKNANVFRFSFILKENIKKDILKEAVNKSLESHSSFKVKLKSGLFWDYFEYNDKVISKRHFRNKIIVSCMLIVFSLAGIITSFLSKNWYSLFFSLPLLYGWYLIGAAFTQKDKIKCISFFSSSREYNRLTSDGNIVTEKKINIIKIVFGIGSVVLIGLGIPFFIILLESNEINSILKNILAISIILSIIIYYLSYLKFSNEFHSKLYGTYLYFYNGKYYKFDR